jgi:hypothetical protein
MLLISSILLWLIVLFNLFLTFALIRRTNATSPPRGGLAAGIQAPDFTAQTLDGETKTLASYPGHRTAFVFFSVHCQPCRALLAQLRLIKEQVQQTGGQLVLVSGDEHVETAALVVNWISLFRCYSPPARPTPFSPRTRLCTRPPIAFSLPGGRSRPAACPLCNLAHGRLSMNSGRQTRSLF